jgi:hypothetical protein
MPQFTGGEPEQPPPPETQKDIIKELFSRNPMKEGDMWYLISEKWYQFQIVEGFEFFPPPLGLV